MRDDLQELVDRVSAVLGAPATLEAADFTLLAFCAHPMARTARRRRGRVDAVRTRSILTRGSPPETRRWFEEFGIATAEGPLRTPDDPVAGIRTRLVLPVRHAGTTLGYLWLLDGGRTDAADPGPRPGRRGRAGRGGGPPARRPGRRDGDLTEVLADRAHRDAVRAGRRRGRCRRPWARHPRSGGAAPRRGAAGRLRRGRAGAVAARAGPPRRAGRRPLPLPAGADLRPAAAVSSAALTGLPAGSTAGLSAVGGGFGGLREQWRHAQVAAAVAAVAGHLSPVASWAELGSWRLVSELPGPDPAVARPAGGAAARRDGGDLPGPRGQRGPHRRRAVACTGRRCTTGSAGSRRSPGWTSTTATPACCCTPPSSAPASRSDPTVGQAMPFASATRCGRCATGGHVRAWHAPSAHSARERGARNGSGDHLGCSGVSAAGRDRWTRDDHEGRIADRGRAPAARRPEVRQRPGRHA